MRKHFAVASIIADGVDGAQRVEDHVAGRVDIFPVGDDTYHGRPAKAPVIGFDDKLLVGAVNADAADRELLNLALDVLSFDVVADPKRFAQQSLDPGDAIFKRVLKGNTSGYRAGPEERQHLARCKGRKKGRDERRRPA